MIVDNYRLIDSETVTWSGNAYSCIHFYNAIAAYHSAMGDWQITPHWLYKLNDLNTNLEVFDVIVIDLTVGMRYLYTCAGASPGFIGNMIADNGGLYCSYNYTFSGCNNVVTGNSVSVGTFISTGSANKYA